MKKHNTMRRRNQCWIENNICHIPLQDGTIAICDADRIHEVNTRSWSRRKDNSRNHNIVHAGINRKIISIYKFLYPDCPPGMVIDHINGNRLDNRSCNLRFCSKMNNSRNQKKRVDSRVQYKGVTYRRNRYEARIGINYKRINIGSYKTAEEAARAYDIKAKELHGEFARLNFPE